MPLALISAILCGLLLAGFPDPAHAQRGKNSFNLVFKEDAVGRNDGNAYVLAYLMALVYPDYLDQLPRAGGRGIDPGYVAQLHTNPEMFLVEYRKFTDYLFHDSALPPSATNVRPTYAFVQGSGQGGGYDPEAVVISTPKAVIVVVRGTDRVAAAGNPGSIGYGAAEWFGSDFTFFARDPDVRNVPGQVHEGFWYSLTAPAKALVLQPNDTTPRLVQTAVSRPQDREFRETLYRQIVAFGGATKKLWITGHSLGSAQAQTLAMWLDARVNVAGNREGIRAQGVYAFAAPHVGNKEFRDNLNARFPNQRLQRFDFVDDPITALPPYLIGYERAGTRVYYDDLKTLQFGVAERFVTDDGKLFPAIAGQTVDFFVGGMTDKNKFFKIRAASALFCFHFPHWYLNAAYGQLNRAQRAEVPTPLAAPNLSDFYRPCGPLDVARGRRNPVAATAEAAKETGDAIAAGAEAIAYNVAQLFANATGSAIEEGTYFIRLAKTGKYLDVNGPCFNQNGCKTELWGIGQSATNNKFVVKKQGLGYVIKSGDRFVEVDANDLFDNNARVQVWEPNLPFGGHASNQVWRFYKVKDDRYVIVNEASGKVLDVKGGCAAQDGCLVRQWQGRDSDPTQVWILEKAR